MIDDNQFIIVKSKYFVKFESEYLLSSLNYLEANATTKMQVNVYGTNQNHQKTT